MKKKTKAKPKAKSKAKPVVQAKDVMTKPVTTVTSDLSIAKLIELIRTTRYSGYPVVDAAGKAVGLISQNDVLRSLAFATGPESGASFQEGKRKASVRLLEAAAQPSAPVQELLARPVWDLMTPKVEACRPDTPLSEVCKRMDDLRIHRVVVCDGEGKVAGLVAALDVVRWAGKKLGR